MSTRQFYEDERDAVRSMIAAAVMADAMRRLDNLQARVDQTAAA